jgi:hypothetical protein
MFPPTRVCLDPECRQSLHSDSSLSRDRELGEAKDHRITVFTLELGAMPGYSTSLYCRSKFYFINSAGCVLIPLISDCYTRYYPNYYVHEKATTRTYYLQPDIPEFIQSAEHFYTGADLCELFTNMMVTAW